MYLRFRVQSTLNFSNYYYVVVFNTTGNGQTPYAASFATFTNYSFALVFGGTSISGASYQLLQVVNSGTSAGFVPRNIPIQTQYVTQFNPNSDGTGNEFTFTFNRFMILTVTNPVGATPIPTSTPSAVPSATATPSPNPSASASASPSPTPTPTPPSGQPTISPGTSTLWALNFFTTDPNFNPIDAIANIGVQDVSFNTYVIDTTASFDIPVSKPVPDSLDVISDPSSNVIQTEVINTP